MKITEVKYTKRFNVGPYEHEEITLHATMDEADTDEATAAVIELKNAAAKAQASGVVGETATENKSNPSATDDKGKKNGKKSRSRKEKEEQEEEKSLDEEETDDSTDALEEEEVQEEETEEETPPPKPSKKGKGSKVTTYSRNNEDHKKIFINQLKGIDKTWKSSDVKKAKAKKLSIKLDGEDFLDADGNMIPAFAIAMRKGFTGK